VDCVVEISRGNMLSWHFELGMHSGESPMKRNIKPVSNQPITDSPTHVDALGYSEHAEALSNLLLNCSATPLTVGIHGDWGTGKTSLMAMIERRVNPLKILSAMESDSGNAKTLRAELAEIIGEPFVQDAQATFQAFVTSFKEWRKKGFDSKHKALRLTYEENKEKLYGLLYRSSETAIDTVWFNTWEYDDELMIWPSLLTTITEYLRDNPRYPAPENQHERLARLVEEGAKPISILVSALSRGGICAKDVEDLLKPDRGLISYRRKLQSAVDDIIVRLGSLSTHRNILLVFIDDLDRCSPNAVIKLLERLKIFFDTKGCVFVLAASEEVISSGIEAKGVSSGYSRYFEGKGSKYLEKIIQLPFHIPPLTSSQKKQLLESLPINDKVEQVVTRLLPYFAPSPRQLKRFVNAVTLLFEIMQVRSDRREVDAYSLSTLAEFVLIRFECEDTYQALVKYGYDFYQRLWNAIDASEDTFGEELDNDQDPIERAVRKALQQIDLCKLVVNFRKLNSEEVSRCLSLVQVTANADDLSR
jgi:hypothetical protein